MFQTRVIQAGNVIEHVPIRNTVGYRETCWEWGIFRGMNDPYFPSSFFFQFLLFMLYHISKSLHNCT